MHSSLLIAADPSVKYQTNEFVWAIPIAMILILGGVTAAAILVCGWGHVKSTAMNLLHTTISIVCY